MSHIHSSLFHIHIFFFRSHFVFHVYTNTCHFTWIRLESGCTSFSTRITLCINDEANGEKKNREKSFSHIGDTKNWQMMRKKTCRHMTKRKTIKRIGDEEEQEKREPECTTNTEQNGITAVAVAM